MAERGGFLPRSTHAPRCTREGPPHAVCPWASSARSVRPRPARHDQRSHDTQDIITVLVARKTRIMVALSVLMCSPHLRPPPFPPRPLLPSPSVPSRAARTCRMRKRLFSTSRPKRPRCATIALKVAARPLKKYVDCPFFSTLRPTVKRLPGTSVKVAP